MNWFHRWLHYICLLLAFPVVFIVCPLLAVALFAMCPPLGAPIVLFFICALFAEERKR
jgi:hypothetical protein